MNIVALRESIIVQLEEDIKCYFEDFQANAESYEEAELNEIDNIHHFVKKGMGVLRARFYLPTRHSASTGKTLLDQTHIAAKMDMMSLEENEND